PTQGQDAADGAGQALVEDFCQSRTFERVGEFGVLGQDVGGQAVFLPQVVVDVLVGRNDQCGIDLQPFGEAVGEFGGLPGGGGVGVAVGGEERGVVPDFFAVRAPVAVQGPAWKLFAGILLAHAAVQH